MQEAAQQIFGPDLKGLIHGNIDAAAYNWGKEGLDYRIISIGGPFVASGTNVLKVVETETEFIVDTVHYAWYPRESSGDWDYIAHYGGELFRYSDSNMKYEDFLEAYTIPETYNNFDVIIAENPDLFPVRRYVLSKEGNGVCYIRQSYLLDIE